MVNAPQCKATAGTRSSHNLKLRTRSKLNLHLHLEFHPHSKRPSLPLGHKKSLGFPASLSYIPTVAITSLSHYTLASVSGKKLFFVKNVNVTTSLPFFFFFFNRNNRRFGGSETGPCLSLRRMRLPILYEIV